MNLDSYLLKPVQRITKYQLLLHQILKYVSEKNPAHHNLSMAVDTMKRSLRYVNDVMHSSGLVGVPPTLDIDRQGELILQDTFVVREGKKGTLVQRGSGPRQRQIFLFEQCIIISKKETEQIGEIGTYEFKDCLLTAKIGCTEVARGDPLTFEIWMEGKDSVYYLRPETAEMKENWLSEIRKILMLQLENEKKRRSHVSPASPLMRIHEPGGRPIPNTPNVLSPNVLSPHLFPASFNFDPTSFRSNRTSSEFEDDYEDDDSDWSDNEFEHDYEELEVEELDVKEGAEGAEGVCSKGEGEDKPGDKPGENEEPRICVNTFETVADYVGVECTELSLQVGDLVNLLKEGEEGWWYCRSLVGDTEGWLPSSYLQKPSVSVAKVETKV